MVPMVVRDECEVEHRRELRISSVDEVYREERFARLDDVAHVVHAPHGGDVAHGRVLHFPQHLRGGGLELLQRHKAIRLSVLQILLVDFRGNLFRLHVPLGDGVGRRFREQRFSRGANDAGRQRSANESSA